MTKTQRYVIISLPTDVVLPLDKGLEAFAALANAEGVRYDWQSKTYQRDLESMPTLKPFSLENYASLALGD